MKKIFYFTLLSLFLVISSCNYYSGAEIIAKGNSDDWDVLISHKYEPQMISDAGKITYLKDNPPTKVHFEYIYPNGFPIGSSGTIEHYSQSKEFNIGGGGGSINKYDNYENLKEKIDDMSISIIWEQDGETYKEVIQLSVNQ